MAKQKIFKNYRLGNIFKRLKDASMIKMYAIIYFNFSGSKEEFKESKETLEDVAKNFDGMELMEILFGNYRLIPALIG